MKSSTVNIPEPPRHLSPLAKQEFRRIAAALAQRGHLDPVRLAALEDYAIAFARCREAEKRLLASTTPAERKEARLDLNNASRQMRIAGRALASGALVQARQGAEPKGTRSGDDNVLSELEDELSKVLHK